MMLLFPAIDILNGKCVRLTEGRFDKETVYGEDPLQMAVRWQKEGGQYLHVVDLDGARQGKSVNRNVMGRIAKELDIPVQVGGGIRSIEAVKEVLSLGVNRVILGSVAVKNPKLVKEACELFGEAIVVGIDAKDGMVAVEGWCETSKMTAIELAIQMAAVGVKRIIYTDISRDGTLSGVNVEATVELAEKSGVHVIASGGVAGLEDLIQLKAAGNIEGVIIGKALYTGAISLFDAIQAVKGE